MSLGRRRWPLVRRCLACRDRGFRLPLDLHVRRRRRLPATRRLACQGRNCRPPLDLRAGLSQGLRRRHLRLPVRLRLWPLGRRWPSSGRRSAALIRPNLATVVQVRLPHTVCPQRSQQCHHCVPEASSGGAPHQRELSQVPATIHIQGGKLG